MGKKVIFLPSCHSTNEVASAFLDNSPLPEGAVVITDKQTHGRGQRGNGWEAEPGKNLTFSLILKPHFIDIQHQFDLNMLISLAIADALNTIRQGFQVKWPNDIYYQNNKVCGILIQNNIVGKTIQSAVVGVGLNVNQQQFTDEKAISLSQITKRYFDRREIFESVLSAIEKRYLQLKSNGIGSLKVAYIENLYQFGEDHQYRAGENFLGRITNVLPDGRLELDTAKGTRQFAFKEVEFL